MAVRLLGGSDMTPETQEFMREHGVRGYPTLLVMNAEGEVVGRPGRSVAAMLKMLAAAE